MFVDHTVGLDTVNISLLKSDKGKEALPLVLSPRWNCSFAFLVEWLHSHRSWLNDMLLQHGAILVRGFDIETATQLEQAIQAYQPSLHNEYRGTSPRNLIDGTEYVFSAAEVPVNFPIAQHIEMSFLRAPPRQLFFGCLRAPKSAGGETALADFRRVFQNVSPELRDKLLHKGIRYVRTHHKKGAYFTYDVSDMIGWPEVFGTDDKDAVERLCREEQIPFEWKGDTFVSTTHSDAFQLHPVTKEPVWFNHTQVFHWTTFPAELWFAWKRTHDVRLLLHCIFVSIFCIINYGILGRQMSLHCSFGDGEPITIGEMQEIRRAIHACMVFSRWQKGDLLMIDNFSISHGRQPTYDKGRKVVVAWADPLEKSNELHLCTTKTSSSVVVGETNAVEEEVFHMENPQERTPETTLSKKESRELKEELVAARLRESLLGGGGESPQDALAGGTIEALKRIVEEAEKRKHRKSHSQPSLVHAADFWAE